MILINFNLLNIVFNVYKLRHNILVIILRLNHIDQIFSTLLFFPDWTNGLPSDFLILHFFVGAIIFPFNMIHAKARTIDAQNPQKAANGYKDSDKAAFFGYEEI